MFSMVRSREERSESSESLSFFSFLDSIWTSLLSLCSTLLPLSRFSSLSASLSATATGSSSAWSFVVYLLRLIFFTLESPRWVRNFSDRFVCLKSSDQHSLNIIQATRTSPSTFSVPTNVCDRGQAIS